DRDAGKKVCLDEDSLSRIARFCTPPRGSCFAERPHMAARNRLVSLATLTISGSATRGIAAVALFAAVQAADGILTLAEVGRFGPSADSDPLMALWRMMLGADPTLSIAKIAAVLLGVVLHGVRWHGTLALLTIFYVFVAVLPWASLVLM